MRYYQKLVSLLVLVLAASFGVGGCVLLYSDFAVQRGRMATANAAAHAQTCTLLQTEILDLQRRGTTMDDAALTARVEARDPRRPLARGCPHLCHSAGAGKLFPGKRRHRHGPHRGKCLCRLRQRFARRAAAGHGL